MYARNFYVYLARREGVKVRKKAVRITDFRA
jgi:hypothetical protein